MLNAKNLQQLMISLDLSIIKNQAQINRKYIDSLPNIEDILYFFMLAYYRLKSMEPTKYLCVHQFPQWQAIKGGRQKRECICPVTTFPCNLRPQRCFIPTGSILQRILLPTLSGIGGHVAVVAGIVRHVKTDRAGRRDTLQRPSQRCHRWLYCSLSLLGPRAVHLRPRNRTCHFEVSRWPSTKFQQTVPPGVSNSSRWQSTFGAGRFAIDAVTHTA